MTFAPATLVAEPTVISGHPEIPLLNDEGNLIQMLTVCAECGKTRSIIMLVRDRWYCSSCRTEGHTNPRMFPIS